MSDEPRALTRRALGRSVPFNSVLKLGEIEIDILHKPIGKQDQYIAAYGGITQQPMGARSFVYT